jgi:hypothetical protein
LRSFKHFILKYARDAHRWPYLSQTFFFLCYHAVNVSCGPWTTMIDLGWRLQCNGGRSTFDYFLM